MTGTVTLSVIIKALNEEKNIRRTIESVLWATKETGAEIILADSKSSDQTVSIAREYPVKVVQLFDVSQRSCGATAQLGYQHSTGEFVYLLDGDMEVVPGFVEAALVALQADKRLAGVGGLMEETSTGIEFRNRQQRMKKRADRQAGIVDRLNGGGVYRRKALEEVGYLADINLHSYEELELAMRLRACGWQLARIPMIAMRHYGHTIEPWRLIWARWASGYAKGPGEFIRSALGRPYLAEVIRELKIYLLMLGVWFVTLLLIIMAFWEPVFGVLAVGIWILMFVAMCKKKRGFKEALYFMSSLQVFSLGLLVGFARPRRDALKPMKSFEI